jgi:AICAR transformylase/IMP cyclohydrolase PurH
MAKLFLEVIAAPAFDEGAKAVFAAKKNLRLVEVPAWPAEVGAEEYLRAACSYRMRIVARLAKPI